MNKNDRKHKYLHDDSGANALFFEFTVEDVQSCNTVFKILSRKKFRRRLSNGVEIES